MARDPVLLGAEDVIRGGRLIRQAANEISQSAMTISEAMMHLDRILDEKLEQARDLVERLEALKGE